MEQIAASSVELNEMAEDLKEQVSRFKLDINILRLLVDALESSKGYSIRR